MLFDLDADPTESNDLSKTEPALFAEMAQQSVAPRAGWDRYLVAKVDGWMLNRICARPVP